jgi:hypothetical protein
MHEPLCWFGIHPKILFVDDAPCIASPWLSVLLWPFPVPQSHNFQWSISDMSFIKQRTWKYGAENRPRAL